VRTVIGIACLYFQALLAALGSCGLPMAPSVADDPTRFRDSPSMTAMQATAARLWYPAVMTAAVALFAVLLAAGSPLPVVLYTPILAAALVIIALERRHPYREDWRPARPDLEVDAAYIVAIQVVWPKVLAMFAVLAAAAWAHERMPSALWPHEWPLPLQVLVMLLLVDLMRYWIHRACHRFDALWRLHEVHHAPEALYALNTARFHPLEKLLHFCADTLAFLLLGVAPEVLAGYFLLYAVNGFFQHSNLPLRYGWLNYVVGSAETHRWHHARDPKTARCNFGSSTVLWDLVFGTWRLPRDTQVGEIGVLDRRYPRSFGAQMLQPFRRRREADGPGELRARIANLLIAASARLTWLVRGHRILALTRDPMRAQRAVLRRILAANQDTAFGREHGFDRIGDHDAFAARVPVRDYEGHRPWIEAEIERDERALTAEPPQRYARTSGTTGKPKDVPLTAAYLADLRAIHRLSVARQYRICPQAFAGGILAITSSSREGTTTNGRPYGAASGIVAESTPAVLRDKFVLPPAVLGVSDSRAKYLLILRLALARPDITYLGSANSTTLLQLVRLYREYARELTADLRHGGFFLADRLTPEVYAAVEDRLGALPSRAAALDRLAAGPAPVRIADLWPGLRLVTTWTGGSAGLAVQALRKELGPRTRILELGYLASEFRATITLGKRAGSGLPTLTTHFFEFVERARWDAGEPEFLTLERLRKGIDYYIVVTTPSGLYRYFINDLVRVTGFLHRTPLIRFVQKGKGVTSITGEKLYEGQVLAATRSVAQAAGIAPRFLMLIADEAERAYRLYVETDATPGFTADEFARVLDAKLGELNLEYHAKRESGRLDALTAAWLAPGAGEAYKQFCVARGQRESQFKAPVLAYAKDVVFDFAAHVAGSRG